MLAFVGILNFSHYVSTENTRSKYSVKVKRYKPGLMKVNSFKTCVYRVGSIKGNKRTGGRFCSGGQMSQKQGYNILSSISSIKEKLHIKKKMTIIFSEAKCKSKNYRKCNKLEFVSFVLYCFYYFKSKSSIKTLNIFDT